MAELTLLQSSGIYLIRNKLNGRVYVGAASIFGDRWRNHRRLLRSGKHHAFRLQRSWNKHGETSFVFEVVEFIKQDDHPDIVSFKLALKNREQYWMDFHNSALEKNGFNLSPAAFSLLGFKRPEETKAKHRAGWTPERRKANSEKGKLQKLSPEHKAAFCFSSVGRTRSPEVRAALSAARIGKKLSPEHIAKVAAAGIGRIHSAATRLKISLSAKARMASLSAEARAARLAKMNTEQAKVKRGKKISISLRNRSAKAEGARHHARQLSIPLEE